MNLISHRLASALAVALLAGLPVVAFAQEPTPTPQTGESNQPVSDTWITTKVKTELLAAKDVSGLKIDVDTVNGVVTLSGKVDSQAQVDKAMAVAKAVQGVRSVDTKGLMAAKHGGH
ncbi:hypothetical protein ASD69_06105 [Lysobacter sp. Root604]|nr:hypothetical protein ASD69_06105 [Lysobacter sp. Root604]